MAQRPTPHDHPRRNDHHGRDAQGRSDDEGQPGRAGRAEAQGRRQGPRLHLRRRGPGGRRRWPTPRARPGCSTSCRRSTPRSATSQTKQFSEELKALGDKVAAYTVSLDLPFAQERFCTDAKIENIKNLSDAHDHSFGEHYGVLIQGLPIPLLARAVFVVDADDTITYVEIVPEIATEPNYEPALAALKAAAGA